MTTPRIEDITGTPIEGEWYLVPTVRGKWHGSGRRWQVADWPIIGPPHNDKADFNFEPMHYHVDGRFVALSIQRHLFNGTFDERPAGVPDGLLHPGKPTHWLHASPLQTNPRCNAAGLPAPVWRRRRCVHARIPYPLGDVPAFKALRIRWSNKPARRDADGHVVCPHRKVSLRNIAPDPDGMITCPLHGLRIDPVRAICLPEEAAR